MTTIELMNGLYSAYQKAEDTRSVLAVVLSRLGKKETRAGWAGQGLAGVERGV
jgi:hypothetical protein